jgi:hypothetical protein
MWHLASFCRLFNPRIEDVTAEQKTEFEILQTSSPLKVIPFKHVCFPFHKFRCEIKFVSLPSNNLVSSSDLPIISYRCCNMEKKIAQ